MTVTVNDNHKEATMTPKSTAAIATEPHWAGAAGAAVARQAADTRARRRAEREAEATLAEAWQAGRGDYFAAIVAEIRTALDAYAAAGGRRLEVRDESWTGRLTAGTTFDTRAGHRYAVRLAATPEPGLVLTQTTASRTYEAPVAVTLEAGALAPSPAEVARLTLDGWLERLPLTDDEDDEEEGV